MNKIRRPRSRIYLAANLTGIIFLAGSIFMLAVCWNKIDGPIPAHYGVSGHVDRWGSKWELLMVPIINGILFAGMTVLEQFPAIWNTGVTVTAVNEKRVRRELLHMICLVKLALTGFFSYIMLMQLKGKPLGAGFVWLTLCGVFAIIIVFFIRTFKKPWNERILMEDSFQVTQGEVDKAVRVMKEVAQWGRKQGYRVWKDEWLNREELMAGDAAEENFYVVYFGRMVVAAFILQWHDEEYWRGAPEFEAGYLHKLCIRRDFAGRGVMERIMEYLKEECRNHHVSFLRLDTGAKEEVLKGRYLELGFEIVREEEYENGGGMLFYEKKV